MTKYFLWYQKLQSCLKNQNEYFEMKSVYFTHPAQILTCQRGITGAYVCDL